MKKKFNGKVSVRDIESEMRSELTSEERRVLNYFKQKKNAKVILQRDSFRKFSV